MIAAIVVHLEFFARPVALPVGFALVRKHSDDSSRLVLAWQLAAALAAALAGRILQVVADSAYAGKALRHLPAAVNWTTRLRSNASLYELAPRRTGKRGRPRLKGAKLTSLACLARSAQSTLTTVTCYGTTTTVSVAVIHCLWYGVFGPQAVQVVLVRERSKTGYNVALVTTDLTSSAAQVLERYASRWSIEVAIEDAKQIVGVGQARNRLPSAVERTVPFTLAVNTLAVCWYATAGHHPDDVVTARVMAPRYRGEDPALGPRHACQAPPCHHRCPISPRGLPSPHPTGNHDPKPGLGGRRCVGEKAELPRQRDVPPGELHPTD